MKRSKSSHIILAAARALSRWVSQEPGLALSLGMQIRPQDRTVKDP